MGGELVASPVKIHVEANADAFGMKRITHNLAAVAAVPVRGQGVLVPKPLLVPPAHGAVVLNFEVEVLHVVEVLWLQLPHAGELGELRAGAGPEDEPTACNAYQKNQNHCA